MSKVQRINFYDNLKFILILLVVVGHFLLFKLDTGASKGLFLFIYSFHVPLFIFITGYFAKKIIAADTNKRMNKIISYLLIYLIYKVLLFVTLHVILRLPYEEFSLFTESEPPWYLLATAIWIIVMAVAKNIKPLYMLIFSIVCSLLVGYESSITDQLVLARVIVFFPFFLMGYYLTFEKINNLINKLHSYKRNILIALILFLIIFFIFIFFGDNLYFIRGLLTGRNPYAFIDVPFDIPLFGLILRFLWFLYNILMALIIFTLIPRRKTFFTEFGSRTMQVYVLHYIVVLVINYSFISVWLQNVFGIYTPLIYVVLGIITTFILSLKIFGKPFNKIMKLNYQKLYKNSEEK